MLVNLLLRGELRIRGHLDLLDVYIVLDHDLLDFLLLSHWVQSIVHVLPPP